MMGGFINLKESGYVDRKKDTENIKSDTHTLYEAVDVIVEYLLKNKAQLILDIDNGKLKRRELDSEISDYIRDNRVIVDNINDYKEIIDNVHNYLWGYGYIDKFIDDLEISDISIKGTHDVWIKRNGKRIHTDIIFPSVQSIKNFAYSIAVKNGGNLSRRDAQIVLSDIHSSKFFNLRIDLGIEPVNSFCPHIVIRKIPKWEYKPDMDKLQSLEMFTPEIGEYISNAFKKGLNTLIVGQGASGKTTVLNAGIEKIPDYMAKLCIQESLEVSSGKPNWIFQSEVKKYGESEIEYDLGQLATNSNLIDTDWVILGESKGKEAMAILDASYTGMKVALTTHAPSEKDGVEKIILNMKKSGTAFQRPDLLRMLSTMDLILFMKRFKVCGITEIEGFDDSTQDLIYNPVYHYEIEKENVDGLTGRYVKVHDSCDRVKHKLSL